MQEVSSAPITLEALKSIFNKAAVGLAVTDLEGQFVYANESYCRMTGYTFAELEKIDFLSITHPDYRRSNIEVVERLLRNEVTSIVLQKEYVKKMET